MQPRRLLVLASGTVFTILLSGCGGGGSTAVNSSVTGTVAFGRPVAGQTVQALDSAGRICATATTASDGTYSVDTSSCVPGAVAFYVAAYTTPSGAPLEAVAVPPQGTNVVKGVVNINPLTTLLAYYAAGLVASANSPTNSGQVLVLLPQITAAQYQQAMTGVLTAPLLHVLQASYGVTTTGFDPTSAPFVANGQGVDGFFDAFPFSASGTSVQVAASSSPGPLVQVTLPTTAGGNSTVISTSAYTIGGNVSGLASGSLTLLMNGTGPFNVTANGAFVFPTQVSSTYAVTVGTQPVGQVCTVSNGSGSGVTANVSNVSITCSARTYTIGGTVTGLAAGSQVTLNDNGADPATVTASGAFTFTTPVAYSGGYAVTVGTQPTGQTCTVSGASGSGVTANVSTVSVTCSTNTYTIGGSVTGLASGTQVTLLNNGADPAVVTANTTFTFATPVAYNSSYAVTVGTQPVGQTCTVSNNGSGSGVTANVSSVSISCSANTYTIGGSVTGLASGRQVTVQNNGADPATVTVSGAFTFATPVAYNGGYAVTVGTQPTGQTCTVSGASGSGVTANVSTVSVTCSTNTYTIGGSVTGLASGTQVTLRNNGADPTVVTANTSFTFATPVAYSGSYAVTVGTQPNGQTCTVSNNGSGSGVTANVSNVGITCSANTYTIGGRVTGLGSGRQVTLQNNGADPAVVTANTTFTFATPVAYNGSYAVTVGTQPNGESCTVSNGSGSGVAANVSNVSVACAANPIFVYVGNYGSNNVLGYSLNPLTGATNNIPGAPFPAGTYDRWVTANPAGTFAYAVNQNSNNVSAYSVNAATGTLTPVPGSPFATGGSVPVFVTVNATGTFAYVANSASGDVTVFSIDPTTGALGTVAGSPFAAGTVPISIAINPAGTFAYVANKNSNDISAYAIDPTTGALTPVPGSPFANSAGFGSIQSITVNAAGTFAYGANGWGPVSGFSIDPTSGALTAVPGSPFASTAGGATWVEVNPAGTFAYLATGNGGYVLTFSIDPTSGALTQVTGGSCGAHSGVPGVNYIKINSAGTYAYMANGWVLNVSVCSIDPSSGALTDVPGSPFGVGARPLGIGVVQH